MVQSCETENENMMISGLAAFVSFFKHFFSATVAAIGLLSWQTSHAFAVKVFKNLRSRKLVGAHDAHMILYVCRCLYLYIYIYIFFISISGQLEAKPSTASANFSAGQRASATCPLDFACRQSRGVTGVTL